jgi:pyroglutamyl-peptidase
MMRRKSRTPKAHATHKTPTPANPLRSRRRARPDAPVPAELRINPAALAAKSPQAPAAPVPRVEGRHRDIVLVTGFAPFGGEKTNPSWEVCGQLGAEIAGLAVETCLVPCEFRRAIEVVAASIERLHPVLVICLGQAGGRDRMSVERVAINIDDARIADNAGAQPIDESIAANGPPAYFSSLPVKAMALAMRAAGVPAEVSNTAGTFVCNHVMYGVLHYLAASGHRARAGFIHVPYSEEQVLGKPGVPSLSIASMVKAVRAGIVAAREHRHDVRAAEGALD